MGAPIDIDDVNAMDAKAFEVAFGAVAEHSPWVAREAEMARPFAGRDAMIAAFARAIVEGGGQQQMELLRAHPQLAARLRMTDDSAREQKGAGLDRLTRDEHQRLLALNTAYNDRFGFPFILAVRGASKDDVLKALEMRVQNPPAAEFARALVEVQKIVRFRIEDRVAP